MKQDDVEVFVLAEVPTDPVKTPTGIELVDLGWDLEETVIMSKEELSELLEERPALKAECEVALKRGSRPVLRLDLINQTK